jgi:hypothetical protein
MYARVMRITWPQGEKVEGMDEVIQAVRDQIVPFAQQLQGFKGFLGLSRAGEIILQSLWETEADLQATEVNHFDDYVKDKLGFSLHLDTTPLWLQDYEVFTSELP